MYGEMPEIGVGLKLNDEINAFPLLNDGERIDEFLFFLFAVTVVVGDLKPLFFKECLGNLGEDSRLDGRGNQSQLIGNNSHFVEPGLLSGAFAGVFELFPCFIEKRLKIVQKSTGHLV